MYWTPYRNYRPDMFRWISRDPAGMIDGPNVYGYVGGKVIGRKDPLGLRQYPGGVMLPPLKMGPPRCPAGPNPISCISRAYDIADNAEGNTYSIRHCVAVCEARRCMGSIGAYAGAILNHIIELLAGGADKEDSARDKRAGDDALNIPVTECDGNDHCTNACKERGW